MTDALSREEFVALQRRVECLEGLYEHQKKMMNEAFESLMHRLSAMPQDIVEIVLRNLGEQRDKKEPQQRVN